MQEIEQIERSVFLQRVKDLVWTSSEPLPLALEAPFSFLSVNFC